ncbi:MAG: HalOD1 output domain-containing protein [Halosimplex sp.]
MAREGDSLGVEATVRSPTGTPASVAVVEAIAAVDGREPDEIPPLFETVDTDALDRLADGTGRSDAAGGLSRISFSHAGHDVAVRGDGSVVVAD